LAATWSPSKERFKNDSKEKIFVPGPGAYNPKDKIDG
jgi:hypothetical protein